MHRVVQAHLMDFSSRFDMPQGRERSFEAFANYIVLKSLSSDSVSPSDLIYEGDDPGIDGIMFFIDDKYVSSVDEVEEAFSRKRRDCDATVVFTQAKTSENWSKPDSPF